LESSYFDLLFAGTMTLLSHVSQWIRLESLDKMLYYIAGEY
jgi:hypothetical protein